MPRQESFDTRDLVIAELRGGIAENRADSTGGRSAEERSNHVADRGSAYLFSRYARSVHVSRPVLLVLDVPNHRHLVYELGRNPVRAVVKSGRLAWQRPDFPAERTRRFKV